MICGARAVAAVMTTVGFIGSGMIGGTVARLSVAAGYDVVLSNSRGPETLKDLVAGLGPRASAATADGAAAAGDLVVVSVPLHACPHLPASWPAGPSSIPATTIRSGTTRSPSSTAGS